MCRVLGIAANATTVTRFWATGAALSRCRVDQSRIGTHPDLTSDVHEGIGKFSDDQIVDYLKSGQATGIGVAAGPMAETISDSLSKLTDDDLRAIAAYS